MIEYLYQVRGTERVVKMRASTVDQLKQNVRYWEKELEEAKKAHERSSARKLHAMRELNKARLAYEEKIPEELGFVDCPILEGIACARNGEVMRKDWGLVYTGKTITRNKRGYSMHRLICYTFNNEESYPQDFLDLFCDVHHKDGNHSNNEADNLCFITKDYHTMVTHRKVDFNDELRKELIAQQFETYSKLY